MSQISFEDNKFYYTGVDGIREIIFQPLNHLGNYSSIFIHDIEVNGGDITWRYPLFERLKEVFNSEQDLPDRFKLLLLQLTEKLISCSRGQCILYLGAKETIFFRALVKYIRFFSPENKLLLIPINKDDEFIIDKDLGQSVLRGEPKDILAWLARGQFDIVVWDDDSTSEFPSEAMRDLLLSLRKNGVFYYFGNRGEQFYELPNAVNFKSLYKAYPFYTGETFITVQMNKAFWQMLYEDTTEYAVKNISQTIFAGIDELGGLLETTTREEYSGLIDAVKTLSEYTQLIEAQLEQVDLKHYLISLQEAMIDYHINQGSLEDVLEGYHQLQSYVLDEDYVKQADQEADEMILLKDTELEVSAQGKKTIVFLPYKASMWDSLESVWRKFAEDTEHYITYVVPLPYAERNEDGSAREWICEKEIFPDDVPTIDWREIDLAHLHPDEIYIHNPYDGMNAVTSVDESYYSHNLKKYTDKLVYIPYFVSGERVEAHFCQLPGVVNADLVILENESIKEQYERYYPGGNPPAGKFVAAGSPKIDKITNLRREDCAIPEQWKNIIGDKKVVLFATSVVPAINNIEKLLAKLQMVLNTFRKSEKVVLWWRPHPLMRATLFSMEQQYYEAYVKLEEEYVKDGWGIFDDTPDMDRAIIWSDAYYGDSSSMVTLYKTTGKPIMIQNYEVLED